MPGMCFVIDAPDDFDDWPNLRITIQIVQLFKSCSIPNFTLKNRRENKHSVSGLEPSNKQTRA